MSMFLVTVTLKYGVDRDAETSHPTCRGRQTHLFLTRLPRLKFVQFDPRILILGHDRAVCLIAGSRRDGFSPHHGAQRCRGASRPFNDWHCFA